MPPKSLSPPIAMTSLFDAIESVQFWVKDRGGIYWSVNRGFLLNYALERPEQVVGRTDFDLSPRHLAEQYVADDERVLAGTTISDRLELVGRFDHTAVWSLTTKLPWRDARDRIVGTVGITRPASERDLPAGLPDTALARVVRFIHGNLDGTLENDALARLAGLSVRAFERQFRKHFDLAPHAYIRRLRVRTACHALIHSAFSLADIAAAHGFCDQSHFNREFRKETGISPGQYRREFAGGRE